MQQTMHKVEAVRGFFNKMIVTQNKFSDCNPFLFSRRIEAAAASTGGKSRSKSNSAMVAPWQWQVALVKLAYVRSQSPTIKGTFYNKVF